MPLYEFLCKDCGEIHTDLVKLGTEASKCPKCNGVSDKVMSVPNFVLKGYGWARDNYGLKKEKKGNKS